MLTLPEIISQLQFISFEMALLGLFITGGAILISKDWRILILALLFQYVLVGVILLRLVRPDIAVLKVLIGAFICPVLFLSARQVSGRLTAGATFRARSTQLAQRGKWPFFSTGGLMDNSSGGGLVFRIFIFLLLMLVAQALGNSFPLAGLAKNVTTAVYWLFISGLIILTITEDPLKAGHGLFTMLIGFDLYYATVESSLLLTGMWGTVNLLIALAIGYLTVVKGSGLEEEA